MLVENIKNKCKEAGTTLAALERLVEFGNGTIARWDDQIPSVNRVKIIADYFGCTVDDLLKGENE